jgi:hypothetical protein
MTAVRWILAMAALLAGCEAGAPVEIALPGPLYCSQTTGAVSSCDAGAGVLVCGLEAPSCVQNENGGWACCAVNEIGGGGIEQTVCPPVPATDASCPCVGCGDARSGADGD